ncbi:MAG: arginine decarboxylase [Bacteroidia bacterium]|nr:arginine decarboxylase [Bacteroidia bacterium]
MENKYSDLIQQTFDFPQEGFEVIDDELHFNNIPLMDIIKQYGTPLKISYLPKISSQIQKAKKIFNVAIAKADYKGKYTYCYCTKSSHFSFVLEEALKNDIHLETSSAFDVPIVRSLYTAGKIAKDTYIINNGYKRPAYLKYISELVNDGFVNTIPILDNKNELAPLEKLCKKKFKVGIRVATDEEPKFEFYTSRLGIRQADIIDYYNGHIKNSSKCELKMLHFFINTGIKDTTYYWTELTKCINVYCDLKKVCSSLDSLDIGGGFPIRASLGFNYDYGYMADEIIQKIKNVCDERGVDEPNIFTEFGSFTVGESGAALYSIVDIKKQNDNELWYMIDSSFITTLPDTWGIKQKFILLAINHWEKEYQRVNLGGLTCDSEDYYNAESHLNQVYMPIVNEKQKEPLYLGFFHTGAYQESLGGYGGIQHCLIPAPKHVIIDKDEDGKITTRLFAKEQSFKSMMKTLGY